MNRESLDTAISAAFYAEEAWRFATSGKAETPDHIYKFVSLDTLHRVSSTTGVPIRKSGSGTFGSYLLDYGGCVFQAARGEAD